MTFRHLTIFLEVCREKNMTRAAKNLFMTQPSVTQAIKELEEYYSVKLFDRIGKKITMNKESYKLLPIAENILRLFKESKNIINENENYQISIGTSITVGTYFITKINDILKNYENINAKYIVDNTNKIEEQLLNFKIDIGIVEGAVHSSNLVSQFVMKDELGLVCSNKNNSFNEKVKLEDLKDSKFIFREEGSGTRELIEAVFLQNNVKVQKVANVNNIEAIKNMIINDIGISILPKISIQKELGLGLLKFIPINNKIFFREFSLVYHKDKIFNGKLEDLIKDLSEII